MYSTFQGFGLRTELLYPLVRVCEQVVTEPREVAQLASYGGEGGVVVGVGGQADPHTVGVE